jgi:hypothetical protein
MVYVLSQTDKKTIKERWKTMGSGFTMAYRIKPHYKETTICLNELAM